MALLAGEGALENARHLSRGVVGREGRGNPAPTVGSGWSERAGQPRPYGWIWMRREGLGNPAPTVGSRWGERAGQPGPYGWIWMERGEARHLSGHLGTCLLTMGGLDHTMLEDARAPTATGKRDRYGEAEGGQR